MPNSTASMPSSHSHSRKRKKPEQIAMADDRQDQRHDADGQHREDELLAERHGGHELGLARPVGAARSRPSSLRATCTKPFDQRLCWAPKSSSLLRQLADHVRLHQEHAVPALEMGAQHQVEVLRQGVVRPAARLLDRGAAPDAAGAVELERHAAAGPDVLLDGEMRRPASGAARGSASCARHCPIRCGSARRPPAARPASPPWRRRSQSGGGTKSASNTAT